MASVFRYRSGAAELVCLPVANDGAVAHTIEIGDLVYFSTYAYNAAHLADAGSADDNRAAFAQLFAGVAVQKVGLQTGETSFKLTTNLGYVVVATSGDFAFDCAATSWATGDKVGSYSDGTGCSSQKVAKVTAADQTIGLAKVPSAAIGASLTEVIVSIRSKLMGHQLVIGSGQ